MTKVLAQCHLFLFCMDYHFKENIIDVANQIPRDIIFDEDIYLPVDEIETTVIEV